MAEEFLQLKKEDRFEALGVASTRSGRPTHLLEKYGAIRRFSEDVDLTYDIRTIAPDLVGESNDEALPPSKSQEKKWTKDTHALRIGTDERSL